MKICITGGSGYLGKDVTRNLKERNISLVQLSRNTHASGETIYYDLNQTTPKNKWFVGCSCLIHCAAQVHKKLKQKTFDKDLYVNTSIKSTKMLIKCAVAAKVNHIIFISSVSVYGKFSAKFPISIDSPLNPNSIYAQTKIGEEQAIKELCKKSSTTYTIIRLPLIFGQNAPGNLHRLKKLVKTGAPLPFLNVDNKRTMVFLYNISDFIGHIAENQPNSSSIIIFSDDIQLNSNELVTLLRKQHGQKKHLFFVPKTVLSFALKIIGKHHVYQQLFEDLIFVPSDMINTSGWNQPYPRKEALLQAFPKAD